MDQVTGGCAHSDRIPPRGIDLNAWIGELARHHQHRIDVLGGCMTNAAWSGSVHKEYRPLRATGAGCEDFVAVDEITTVDSFDRSSETNRFVGFASLRFAAPCNPLFAALDDALKPACFLFFGAHAVEKDERVDVAFPAACERHVRARDLLGHHPEREHVAGVWTKPVAAVLFRNHCREQVCLE